VVQGGTGYYKKSVRRIGVKVAYCKKNPVLTEAAFWKIWLSKYFMWYEAKSA